jgi:hypothetical protein
MNTIIIKGSDWYRNVNAVNTDMQELNAAIEICYKKDMETLKKAHHLDKQKLFAAFIRKYPHHKIAGY